MKTTNPSEIAGSELKVSRKLHPEDIVIGDQVAVSEVGYQCASFMWCGFDSTILPPDRVVSLTFYPCVPNEPLTVQSVCLPFVLCEMINGDHVVHDVRQTQLVRLDQDFAGAVRCALKANEDSKKSKTKSAKSKKNRNKKLK